MILHRNLSAYSYGGRSLSKATMIPHNNDIYVRASCQVISMISQYNKIMRGLLGYYLGTAFVTQVHVGFSYISIF